MPRTRVTKVPFDIGKPQLRPPWCEASVTPEEKRRFLARRAQETEQRATSNGVLSLKSRSQVFDVPFGFVLVLVLVRVREKQGTLQCIPVLIFRLHMHMPYVKCEMRDVYEWVNVESII